MSGEIRFTVPLPPVSLRANSRAHWSQKKRDADYYSIQVWNAYVEADLPIQCCFWKRAKVTYTWHYAGVEPDHGNLGGNTKYLQDIICMAPKSKAGKDRYYLGIVEDDKGIVAEYRSVKVPKRDQEHVQVVITRIEEAKDEGHPS